MRALKAALAGALALASTAAFAQVGGGVGPVAAPAASGSRVFKVGPSDLFDVNVVAGGTAGYVMVIDAATVPADGAVTPALCMPLAANTGILFNLRAAPARFVRGIVVVFSSGASCFAKTESATAFISASSQ